MVIELEQQGLGFIDTVQVNQGMPNAIKSGRKLARGSV